MFTIRTLRRKAATRLAIAASALAALGGGIYSAQAADGDDGRDQVVRAADAKVTGDPGDLSAAASPGNRFRTVPPPETTRAAEPSGDTNGGLVVAAEVPRNGDRAAGE